MLDALLKPKFYNKCKVAIKLTKTRLEVINKKRCAMLKFLRNDIADLLRNRLDDHAYARVQGLIVEQNMTCCYNLIHHFCTSILAHLSTMLKHSECPEECREAVSSLVFAAARFADLPELRDLRTLFSNKYGTSIDTFVNKEFASRLSPQPPSKEMKVELMREIALDISLKWDSKALEQKLLFTPSPPLTTTNVQPLRTHPTTPEQEEEKYKKEAPPTRTKCSSNTTRTESLPNSQRRAEGKFQSSTKAAAAAAGNNKDVTVPLKMEPTAKKEAAMDNAPLPEEKRGENKKLPSPSSYRNIPPPYLITAKPEKQGSSILTAKADHQPKPRSVRQIRGQFPQPQSSDVQKQQLYEEDKADTESLQFGAPPSRVVSLPPEAVKPNHNLLRPTTSLQHDGHIHPNLPDYDDLTTRMASLRKR